MRIIAGQFRGTRLAAVGKGDAAAHLRPTPDRVRESLFNVLGAYVDWDGLRVLDLFAGTGALGLEALSRGADHASFVDQGRASLKLLMENIDKLRVSNRTRVLRQDATRFGPAEAACGLIFLDPPYGKGLGEKALAAAHRSGWIAPGAVVVWEEAQAQVAPDGFDLLDQRSYGGTVLTILEAAS